MQEHRPTTWRVPVTNRLEKIRLADGARTVLRKFPLSQFGPVAIAADGKTLAWTSNEHASRTEAAGHHLYVGSPGEASPRRLTDRPFVFRTLVFDERGDYLYALARHAGPDLDRFPFGDGWMRFRIKDGARTDLAAPGKIDQFWMGDGSLFVRILSFQAGRQQQGVFRLDPKVLAAQAVSPRLEQQDLDVLARKAEAAVADALGGRPLSDLVPDEKTMRQAADAFAGALDRVGGRRLDFSPGSLDRLPETVLQLRRRFPERPLLLFGLGAYYGETLRRSTGARWFIQPRKFGDWLPAGPRGFNPFVETVQPFSQLFQYAQGNEDGFLFRGEDLQAPGRSRRIVLVYPPQAADAAVRSATPPDYFRARKLLDKGKVDPALDLLVRLLERDDKLMLLAEEIVGTCIAAERPELADRLALEAVRKGSKVPQLLLRAAAARAAAAPDEAMEYCRLATQSPWPMAEALVQLGDLQAARGNLPEAQCCWRRAYPLLSQDRRVLLREKLDLPPLGTGTAVNR